MPERIREAAILAWVVLARVFLSIDGSEAITGFV